jgi:hypothetical protein
MQPYFFPYIGYWQLIYAVDKYIIYDDVNFIKGGWINRNNILMNGEAKLVNIQMHNASPNKLINEVEVSDNYVYKGKLLKTLNYCYKKAPFFQDVFPVIENVIKQEEKNLAKYLECSIRQVCEYLSIDTNIVISSDINKSNDLRAQDKVIDICKIVGAHEYINAIGGEKLYSREAFSAYDIQLKFLKIGEVRYPQLNNEFVPNLSIIDVMMFNSLGEIKEILNNFTLV